MTGSGLRVPPSNKSGAFKFRRLKNLMDLKNLSNLLFFVAGRGKNLVAAANNLPKKTAQTRTPSVPAKPSASKLQPAEENYSHQKKRERPGEFDDYFPDSGVAPPPAQRPRTVVTPASIAAAVKRIAQTPVPPPRTTPQVGPMNRYMTNNNVFQRSTAPWRPYGAQARGPAPAGLINLGNTCYLNAVLQSLFSLPTFLGAVRAAAASCGNELPSDGVLRALTNCLAERDASAAAGRSAFSPEQIKLAVGLRLGAFRGSFQQDAHEFFCGLLEAAQGEVLAIESARLNRRQIHASETSDPATRVFGFAVDHEITCSGCGKVSNVTEQCTHLSLDLPKNSHGAVVPLGLDAMLSSYFAEEAVDKGCEGCEADCISHTVRRRIKRLPQILALHVKRFQVSVLAGGRVTCAKVRDPISIQAALRLRKFCVEKPAPPLPQLQPPPGEAGKENLQANTGVGMEIKLAGPMPLPSEQRKPSPEPAIRSTNFYSSNAGAGLFNEPVRTFSRKPKGAASSSYWDGPAPAQESKSLWTDKAAGIIGASSSDKAHHLGDAEEDAALAAALEASKREAERIAAAEEQEALEAEELATAIKRSLEEQQQHEQQQGIEIYDFTESEELVLDQADKANAHVDIDLGEAVTPGKGQPCGNESLPGGEETAAVPFSPLPEIVEDSVQLNEGKEGGHEHKLAAEGVLTTVTPPAVAAKGLPLAQYRLTAVISHHGPSAESGHFTADTRNASTGEWYRFNDAQVHRIAGDAATNEMREKDCYMLFYTTAT